jgi:hypothetical protein
MLKIDLKILKKFFEQNFSENSIDLYLRYKLKKEILEFDKKIREKVDFLEKSMKKSQKFNFFKNHQKIFFYCQKFSNIAKKPSQIYE